MTRDPTARAEGLTLSPDGRRYASWHRVHRFLRPGWRPAGPPGESHGGRGPGVVALLELSSVLDALETRGVPAIPLKGPLLGARLWGDPTVRASQDLDVLVPADRLAEAADLLAPLAIRHPAGDEYHHLGLTLGSGRRLELHSTPLGPRTGSRIAAREVWGQAGWREDAGMRYRTLPPVAEQVVVTVHAAQHLGYRLLWMSDVGAMLASRDESAWEEAVELAARWRVRRSFVVGAVSASQLFGVPLPAPVARAVGRGEQSERVVQWMVERLFGGAASLPTQWERWPRWLALLEDTATRVRVVGSLSFRPTGADRAATGLSTRADALAGLLRPLLVMRRALRR